MLNYLNLTLVSDAKFDGYFEIPIIQQCNIDVHTIKSIIPFSEILRTNNYNQWVCFYEDDELFERIWNNPYKYLSLLKKFEGVITPDFSVYQDYNLNSQIFNINRQRVIGYWLQKNGINVIVNVRWGDSRTYYVSTCGVPKNSVIAIGTVGCARGHQDTKRTLFEGLDYIASVLTPKTIIVYGPEVKNLFSICELYGIEVIHFKPFRWKDREVQNG